MLVDLSNLVPIKNRWRHPLACTAAAWQNLQQAAREDFRPINDVVHEMSKLGVGAILRHRKMDLVRYTMRIGGKYLPLKLHLGPGDDGKPVFTLMLQDED